ncbi:MAG: acyltransferase family protein [Acidimicrobiia bacterium]|nr:acyltransferase family protein [Acidimicrobiia bacterium]
MDPQTVLRFLPTFQRVSAYFATEVRGFDRLPDGPFLLVGNHSGGILTCDVLAFWAEWVHREGPDRPIAFLAHDFLFKIPRFGDMLTRLGVLPASPTAALDALDAGIPVSVLPGGEWECLRPWHERNRIDFGGHSGFVETALKAGVPVVPLTSHGSHESTFVLTRGERIASFLGLDRLRAKVLPIVFSIPFGVGPALPSLPLPAKVTIEIGEPLDWSVWGSDVAADPEMVAELYDEVVETMQATMDRLAAETPWPLIARWTR